MHCIFYAYNALLVQRHDPVLDPDAPTAHHVGQHHVRGQPITDNGDLVRPCHPGFRVLAEVRQDLVATARLLHRMREDIEPGRFLNLGSKPATNIVARRAGSIGHYQKTTSGVGRSQSLEARLLSLAMGPQNLSGRART